ncbi:hypothetical protein BGI31_00720 [Snodgrassella communis]|nr:hypothetical protein BGI31_00720 [Snodgrassella communis]
MWRNILYLLSNRTSVRRKQQCFFYQFTDLKQINGLSQIKPYQPFTIFFNEKYRQLNQINVNINNKI